MVKDKMENKEQSTRPAISNLKEQQISSSTRTSIRAEGAKIQTLAKSAEGLNSANARKVIDNFKQRFSKSNK